jgi:hypothetical protein
METTEQAINRAFKGIVGRRSASKFERGRRAARAIREETEQAAWRSVSRQGKKVDLAKKMLNELINPDNIKRRIERRHP